MFTSTSKLYKSLLFIQPKKLKNNPWHIKIVNKAEKEMSLFAEQEIKLLNIIKL